MVGSKHHSLVSKLLLEGKVSLMAFLCFVTMVVILVRTSTVPSCVTYCTGGIMIFLNCLLREPDIVYCSCTTSG